VTGWHLDEETIGRYARGRVPMSVSASVESHLMSCARCREALAPAVDLDRLATLWDDVLERVEPSRAGPVERLLHLLGVSDGTARLLAATPALRGSWLLALAGALLFATVATLVSGASEGGTLLFLATAPILPVAGVAAAFHRGVDPTYEIGLAAPYPQFRLLLLRSAAVTGVSCAAALGAGLVLPTRALTAAAWLLPALALTSLTLVLTRKVDIVYAAAAVSGAWAITVAASQVSAGRLVVFGVAGQLICLGVAVAAQVVLVADRERYATELGGA